MYTTVLPRLNAEQLMLSISVAAEMENVETAEDYGTYGPAELNLRRVNVNTLALLANALRNALKEETDKISVSVKAE
jgi:hypothetical protein